MFDPEFDDPDGVFEYSLSPSFFSPTPPPPLLIVPGQLDPCFEFDSASKVMKLSSYPETPRNNSGGSSGGSCISSPSCGSHVVECGFMQRSCSTLSLQKDPGYRFPFGSSLEFTDAEDVSFRRVCSTGDLERINGGSRKGQRSGGSQLMSESNMIIEGLSRTCRYSPEEKKERIERYRSKRTQRNFNKKIKAGSSFNPRNFLPYSPQANNFPFPPQYACRKTLADSRPRVRGRFARNDEIEKAELQLPWNHVTEPGEEEEEEEEDPDEYHNWVVEFLDACALSTESNQL